MATDRAQVDVRVVGHFYEIRRCFGFANDDIEFAVIGDQLDDTQVTFQFNFEILVLVKRSGSVVISFSNLNFDFFAAVGCWIFPLRIRKRTFAQEGFCNWGRGLCARGDLRVDTAG